MKHVFVVSPTNHDVCCVLEGPTQLYHSPLVVSSQESHVHMVYPLDKPQFIKGRDHQFKARSELPELDANVISVFLYRRFCGPNIHCLPY